MTKKHIGAPRRINDVAVNEILRITREETPPDKRHWTTRSLAKHVGLSATTIRRFWIEAGINGGIRYETEKTLTNVLNEMRLTPVALFLAQPYRALILSNDQSLKTEFSLDINTSTMLTCSVDLSLQIINFNNVIREIQLNQRREVQRTTPQEKITMFRRFLEDIDSRLDRTGTVHIILDKLNACEKFLVTEWINNHKTWSFSSSATNSSWRQNIAPFLKDMIKSNRQILTDLDCIRRNVRYESHSIIIFKIII